MRNARRFSEELSSPSLAGGPASLGWALPSEAASVRIGTFALVVGGVLSLALLVF